MFEGVALHSIPGVRGVTIDDYDFPVDESLKWNVLVAHQSVVPDKSKLIPQLRDKDFMHDSQEVANATKCNVVLYGHEHARHGVYKRTNAQGEPVVFVNLGAISRGTIDESDLKKEPAVYLLDFKPGGLSGGEYKLKNVRSIEDCYLLEEHFQKVDHKQATEDAINALKDTRLERFSVESVIADVEIRDDITNDVRDATLELLETVR
jgi:hypothetical protein